jgi:hypothetical protein
MENTAIDTRNFKDIGRQCDNAQAQISLLQRSLDSYKRSNSWDQLNIAKSSIESIQQHMRDLQC